MRGSTRRGRIGALRLAAGLLATSALLLAPGGALAATTVNLDQWASSDFFWQNGNLNGNNSRYPEGGIVPFRLAIEGLSAGNHEILVDYDFTAGGHKAYDFLATWNATNAAGAICTPSGGAISSMCPSLPTASTFTFPTDTFATDGLTVAGAQAYAGIPRKLTLWGGTITGISAPAHSGSAAGNSSVEIRISFHASGSAVLLAWGGHLAQSSFWNTHAGGTQDGAKMVSGAPWHMRTLGLDGSGAKNQDRSIQPSAIVGELPPGGPTPAPAPTPRPAATPRAPTPTSPAVAASGPIATPPDTTFEAAAGAPTGPARASLWLFLAGVVVAFALILTSPRRTGRRAPKETPRHSRRPG